jgi:Organic Anion Transporter Polypeptide (OATP) family
LHQPFFSTFLLTLRYFGWIVLGFALLLTVPIMAMFPKHLPRAAARNAIKAEKEKRLKAKTLEMSSSAEEKEEENGSSINGLLITFKRLLTNKIFMLNNIAGIFYIFG